MIQILFIIESIRKKRKKYYSILYSSYIISIIIYLFKSKFIFIPFKIYLKKYPKNQINKISNYLPKKYKN